MKDFFGRVGSVLGKTGEKRAFDLQAEQGKVIEGKEIGRKMFTDHLDNLSRSHREIERLLGKTIVSDKKNRLEEGFTASQLLLGAAALPAGIFMRPELGNAWGAILCYQGAHMLFRGIGKWWQFQTGVPLEIVEARMQHAEGKGDGKQKFSREVGSIVSEESYTKKLFALKKKARTIRSEFAAIVKEYKAQREEKKKRGESIDLQDRIDYLTECTRYLSDIIENQEAIATAMKEQYHGLVRPHQKVRDWLGAAFATGILTGSQWQLSGSPKTPETFLALASGIGIVLVEEFSSKQKTKALQWLFENIGHEIGNLRHRRMETAAKLARLEKKAEKQKQATLPALPASEQPSKELSDVEQSALDHALEEWRSFVADLVSRAPYEMLSSQTVAATARPISGFERSALAGFLGARFSGEDREADEGEDFEEKIMVPNVVSGGVRLTDVARSTAAPTFPELLSGIGKAELEGRLTRDALAIIDNPKFKQQIQDKPLSFPELIIHAAISKEISPEAFDELLRYYEDLNEAFTQKKSVKGFFDKIVLQSAGEHEIDQVRFFEVLERAMQRLEEALKDREEETVKRLFQEKSPEEIRSYMLNRFGVAKIDEKTIAPIQQGFFENALRTWKESGRRREYDLKAFQRFLETAEQVIQAHGVFGEKKAEKQEVVERALRILKISGERRFENMERLLQAYLRERSAGIPKLENPAERLENVRLMDFVAAGKMKDGSIDISDIQLDIPNETVDYGMRTIPTDAIIGSYLPAEERASWIGKNSDIIEKIAEQVIKNPTNETFNDFFIDPDKGSERIQVWRLSGPGGKIYFAMLGADYIAAAKYAGIPEIPVRVYEVRQPSPVLLGSLSIGLGNFHTLRYQYFKNLHKAGLMDATFHNFDIDITNSRSIPIEVSKVVVPWLLWFSGSRCSKISQIFEKLYPGNLKKVKDIRGKKIDPDTLTNQFTFQKLVQDKGEKSA